MRKSILIENIWRTKLKPTLPFHILAYISDFFSQIYVNMSSNLVNIVYPPLAVKLYVLCFVYIQKVNGAILDEYIRRVYDAILRSEALEALQPRIGKQKLNLKKEKKYVFSPTSWSFYS